MLKYHCTDDFIETLNIFRLIEHLFGKMSIMEIHKKKSKFKYENRKTTRNTDEINVTLTKPNTTFMQNVYDIRGIKLFIDVSYNIKN